MKPTGFIQETKLREKRPFEQGDWVKSGNLGFGLQSVGIVNEEMKVTWLDGVVSNDEVNTTNMKHIRHLTLEELGMFNLKAD